MERKSMGKKVDLKMLRQNSTMIAMIAFGVLAFALIMAGVFAMRVPVVSMCVLVMLEAGIAVMLHRAEIWVHGLLVLAEILAGILINKLALVVLCTVVYVAATAALQVLGKDEQVQ